MLMYPAGLGLNFGPSLLHLHPYFVYESSECFGESAHLGTSEVHLNIAIMKKSQ